MRDTAGVFFALFAIVSSSEAQSAAHVEAGGARVRYSDSVAIAAATISAGGSALTSRASISGSLAGSTTQQSSWTVFGSADAAVFALVRGSVRAELHGGGSFSTYGQGVGSGRALGGARLHFMRSAGGAWIGAGAGGVRDPIGWRSLTAGEIGAWARFGATDMQAVALPVRIQEGVSYTDVEGTVRVTSARGELLGTAGVRTSVKGFEESAGHWAGVNAVAWILPRVEITGGVGRYPSDPGQDLPAAMYATLGLRVSQRSARRPNTVLPMDVQRVSTREAPVITVSGGTSSARRITLRASAARSVELMGDFTDWAPVSMERAEAGTWAASLPVTSGVHQVNVRIDGGEWSVPAGLTAIKDEFGGSVGILLVP